ncbi:MAG TPA: hypothetical protein VF577_04735, partial [Allosphingosinicella sp.]
YYADYAHLNTGEIRMITANTGTASETPIASFGYDGRGRRTSFVRPGGSTDYRYPDAFSSRIEHHLPGTHSVDIALEFNPAGQIVSREVSNDSYAWTGDVAGTVNSTANGRNQLIELDGATPQYDARGNMTRNDAFSFGYSSENLMTEIGAPGGSLAPIPYDPLGRLAGDGNTSFLTDPAEAAMRSSANIGAPASSATFRGPAPTSRSPRSARTACAATSTPTSAAR